MERSYLTIYENQRKYNVFSEFPEGCTSYQGPHSLRCLSVLWEQSGCIKEGYHVPTNMSHLQKERVDQMNLR